MCSLHSGGDCGFVLLVGRAVVLLAMDDKTLYTKFRWSSSEPKLAKAVKVKMGEMMRTAQTIHKTSVLWHEVAFVPHGIVVPFKKANSYRSTWAWLYRTLMPFITKQNFGGASWKWEPLESEVATDGASTSLGGQDV